MALNSPGDTSGATLNDSFWQGRKVLITGHTGFKGTWLSLWLQRLGATLTGYSLANEPKPPRMFELVGAGADMHSVLGDIRDYASLQAAVSAVRPEVVFHMAAQPLVRRSYQEPVATFDTNVMGTVNLLEACRHCDSIRAVVVVTTDKCYENREWVWGYREGEAMGGHDPYSASKGCAELVTTAFRRSFFADGAGMHAARVATARAGNVIGGGDWAEDRLIPDMMRAFARREPVRIRSPRSTRPWQHVLEPLGGYLQLGRRLLEGGGRYEGAWNFGPEDADAREVGWIVDYVARRWGSGAEFRIDAGDHPHEAGVLRLDISKARHHLQWSPRLRLEQALDWLVDWYRLQVEDQQGLRALTLRQIDSYVALAPKSGVTQPC